MNNIRILPLPWLMGFFLALLFVTESYGATTKQWRAYREGARVAAQANDADTALQQYALAFSEAEAAFKGTDTRFLETVAEAANFHVQMRQFDGALKMYESALNRMPKAKGGEQAYKATFLTDVGSTLVFARRLEQAEEAFQTAAQYAEEKLGDKSPFLARALEGQATVHIERQESEKALPLLKRALLISTSGGGGHAFFDGMQVRYQRGASTTEYSVQNTLGILYLSQSNYVEAEKYFRDALKTVNRQRSDAGMNFIKANTASLNRNLAQAHRGQREFRDAEDALIRSIVVSEDLQGSAVALSEAVIVLAAVHYEAGDDGLESLCKRLSGGKSNEPNAENFLSYAEVMARYYANQDWARTETFIQKARSAVPQHSAQIASLGSKLAMEAKHAEAAENFLSECVVELRKTHGDKHAGLVSPLKDLADIQSANGKSDAAGGSYAEVVAVARAAFGEKDSRLANALDDQAAFLARTGKTTEAGAVKAEADRVRAAALLR